MKIALAIAVFLAILPAQAHADKGQNQRHIDMAWPLWNVLDFTPEGRGKDWYPKLDYAALTREKS